MLQLPQGTRETHEQLLYACVARRLYSSAYSNVVRCVLAGIPFALHASHVQYSCKAIHIVREWLPSVIRAFAHGAGFRFGKVRDP